MLKFFLGVLIAAAFGGAMAWYLVRFLFNGFGLEGKQTTIAVISVSIVIGVIDCLAICFGWTAFFVIMAGILIFGQVLMTQRRSKLAFYLLIAGQMPAAIVSIAHDIQCSQWNWLNWFFALLIFPLIEIAIYYLATFISTED